MNLAQLIEARKRAGAGSLRDMAHRAADRGTPISRTTISDYGAGKQTSVPDEDVRRALANALDVSFEVVTAAALETVAPNMTGDGRTAYRAEAWLKLTAGRSDEEVEHLLGVITAVLRATDASRSP